MAIQISEDKLSPKAKEVLNNAKSKSKFLREAVEFYVNSFSREELGLGSINPDDALKSQNAIFEIDDIKQIKAILLKEVQEISEIKKNFYKEMEELKESKNAYDKNVESMKDKKESENVQIVKIQEEIKPPAEPQKQKEGTINAHEVKEVNQEIKGDSSEIKKVDQIPSGLGGEVKEKTEEEKNVEEMVLKSIRQYYTNN